MELLVLCSESHVSLLCGIAETSEAVIVLWNRLTDQPEQNHGLNMLH